MLISDVSGILHYWCTKLAVKKRAIITLMLEQKHHTASIKKLLLVMHAVQLLGINIQQKCISQSCQITLFSSSVFCASLPLLDLSCSAASLELLFIASAS